MCVILNSPQTFDGTLGELFDRSAEKVLLDADVVQEFHLGLVEYLASADPLFLVRLVKGTVRGEMSRTDDGSRLRPTDNAPSWWIHRELCSRRVPSPAAFEAFIEAIPSHMFQMPSGENINGAGWHVAHIFGAKNGDVSFAKWGRAELLRRTVRNIHPCNYFYIPKPNWQRHGGDPTVISFFCEKFASRYSAIWPEFLRLADGVVPAAASDAGQYRIAYACTTDSSARNAGSIPQRGAEPGEYAVCYSYSRLCFKADLIEPLSMTDRFCIVTKIGAYALSKQAFYDVFPGVVASDSYRIKRIYHFPKPPAKALQFRVDSR